MSNSTAVEMEQQRKMDLCLVLVIRLQNIWGKEVESLLLRSKTKAEPNGWWTNVPRSRAGSHRALSVVCARLPTPQQHKPGGSGTSAATARGAPGSQELRQPRLASWPCIAHAGEGQDMEGSVSTRRWKYTGATPAAFTLCFSSEIF